MTFEELYTLGCHTQWTIIVKRWAELEEMVYLPGLTYITTHMTSPNHEKNDRCDEKLRLVKKM